ncbi:hypothetical protein CPT03_04145 [Pedobacter ginsengisoli]|uniref:Uncharacterized protein n=1 Tax=Pedobacter ginsengisoli TaxID=363852 RepID=A0A2D1U2I4_9SPHI|nr:hypothetical protein [Pedobacter ginsengisoli]ATP55714.1 hypothetical protein CPT03_04145 [Pedobacter ginsengisoli]
MLQNRVDPFGNIIRTSARGTLMGNRGLLHNEKQEIRRPFKLTAWITCVLEFKGRRRPVMAVGQYTELFFLDEATSFAAGHRPCFECRRPEASAFKRFWLKGNHEYGFNAKTPIKFIDDVLQRERIDQDCKKITFMEFPEVLPIGTFVIFKSEPYLIKNGMMYRWSAEGYEAAKPFPKEKLSVLTPKSVVNTFSAGYVPLFIE